MKKSTLIILIILVFVSCKKEKDTKVKETLNQVEVSESQQYLCEDVVIAIIESSNESKEEREGLLEFIKERGGSSYGYMLEACPNPQEDNLEKSEYPSKKVLGIKKNKIHNAKTASIFKHQHPSLSFLAISDFVKHTNNKTKCIIARERLIL